jgi:hypothetical protein
MAKRIGKLTAKIERKQDSLPRYAVIPKEIALVGGASTYMAEASVNGVSIGRRSIKPWGDRKRWFIEFTGPQMEAAGVDTGDEITLELKTAPAEPPELTAALKQRGLMDAWQAVTPSRRRLAAEQIFEAATETTRAKRVAAIVKALQKR